MNIHELFKHKRLEKGLTQQKAANKIGVRVLEVARWENSTIPHTRHLYKICKLYGLTLKQIDSAIKEIS